MNFLSTKFQSTSYSNGSKGPPASCYSNVRLCPVQLKLARNDLITGENKFIFMYNGRLPETASGSIVSVLLSVLLLHGLFEFSPVKFAVLICCSI